MGCVAVAGLSCIRFPQLVAPTWLRQKLHRRLSVATFGFKQPRPVRPENLFRPIRSNNLIDHDFIAAIDLKSLNWAALKPVHHLLACPGSDIAILARNSVEQRPGRDAASDASDQVPLASHHDPVGQRVKLHPHRRVSKIDDLLVDRAGTEKQP